MLTIILSTVLAAPAAEAGQGSAAAAAEAKLRAGIDGALKRATNALIDRQNPDGGYGPLVDGKSDLGITALVLWALAASPLEYREYDGPYISAAVDYLLTHQKEDGGIHDGSLWNYKTCIGIMALAAADAKKYAGQIAAATAFVKKLQLSEESPVPYDQKRHANYGGWGYGSTRRADLSNTQFAVEALATGGVAGDDPVFRRALVFLGRTQNSCDTNDAITDGLIPLFGTNDDGGFMYRPGQGQLAPRKLQDGALLHSSYGSMTYAGVKSLVYAHLDRNDPRVRKAYAWLCQNYTVEENPGMATKEDTGRSREGLY